MAGTGIPESVTDLAICPLVSVSRSHPHFFHRLDIGIPGGWPANRKLRVLYGETSVLPVIGNVWNQTAFNPVAYLKGTNRCTTN